MTGVAILSGTAGTAGDAFAGRLADEGFDLAVLGPSPQAGTAAVERARRSGRRAQTVTVRMREAGSVQQAVDHVDQHLGPPAVLLHVVEATLSDPLCEVQDWDEYVGGLLREAFLISRAVLDPMIRQGRGRIVTVADVLGRPGRSENAAVRTGLEGFTRTLALEADPFGITANLVVAGPGIGAQAAAEILPPVPGPPSPGGRAEMSAELAAIVGFLAGDAAAHVSGQVIHVAATAGH
ncbi:SDR family NAD(P)-dependent oxidoreductase [Streptomyces sp. PU-14G]|uniref:SDR family NAD(P)-dependent oxidoreductase n=1 Tax=Streptomyces sp. PU-14G TaxID=2800808 RepID=UPI0034DF552E